MMYKEFCCAICGNEQHLSFSDLADLAKALGKSFEEIDEIKTCVCGDCSKTEEYRQSFFLKPIPHIVLAEKRDIG